eukprot:TRINITY_DN56729_c0_g1_i1.p1 TRINITY_DN56729_c0_g1~~TRINITY_DN56729_c0_g1_i1.p1  ORF type:complete len:348 (+),score=57.03 TRINITY_DN56729_c0_g1_i1:107-1150(+)
MHTLAAAAAVGGSCFATIASRSRAGASSLAVASSQQLRPCSRFSQHATTPLLLHRPLLQRCDVETAMPLASLLGRVRGCAPRLFSFTRTPCSVAAAASARRHATVLCARDGVVAAPVRGYRNASAVGTASAAADEQEPLFVDAPRANYLPASVQKEERPPAHLRWLTAALLAPLVLGALAVHLLALGGGVDEAEAQAAMQRGDVQLANRAEYSRLALSWSLHYAGVLLSFAGASHWGMQLAEFGVPVVSENMGLYYLCRFSAPIVFVLFGWLGSVLSFSDSWEAVMWLLCGFTGLLSCDFLACTFFLAPPWWFRWRAGFSVVSALSLLVLLLSERNLYIGPKPKIRM